MEDVTGVWISSAVLWPGDFYEQKLTTEYTNNASQTYWKPDKTKRTI